MLDFSGVLEPSIITWLAVILLAVVVQFIVTNRALGESNRVQRALLREAKARTQKQVSVVIDLNRRAETIFDLLDHLIALHYNKLDVVVIIRRSAGKNAKKTLEAYRKTSELKTLTLVSYRKGATIASLATQYAKGTVLLQLEPTMRLSDRFFERVSYGLLATKSSLLVRRYRRPERTLMSAWASLSSLWRSLFVPFSKDRRTVIHGELVVGMPVLKTVIRKGADYLPEPLLFDDYGIDLTASPASNKPYAWQQRLIIAIILLGAIGFAVYLMQTTARDMLAFVGWLTFGIYVVSSLILLSHFKGLGRLERFLVYLLIPFYPLYLIYRAVYRILQVDERPKRPRPLKRPTQPVTQ